MGLDADIARYLAELAQATQAAAPPTLAALREGTDAGLRALHGAAEAMARTEDFTLPARDGAPLRVRIYRPLASDTPTPQPALVFAHGGGWCLGSLEVYDNPCRALAAATGAVVVSVDYRLAPEHRFPVPLHDFCDAIAWTFEQADALGLDRRRIGVAMDSPSFHQFGEGHYLTRAAMEYCYGAYLGDAAPGRQELVSPLRADHLAGLPQATVISCEYDPLRDEAEAYAQRLAQAGVAVKAVRLPGMVHACMHMLGLAPASRRLFDEAGAAVRQALGTAIG
ncbi:alpha/beta hydrolase [Delftia sp. Lp-1]|uniref:alpha/beta hydrolase n=1 Tax=Delftia sp. Lp-1 TaxID=682863 RepID=UPI001E49375E|nr:alpha/beta hydrolase [Delftia sp. Lp-1]MCB4786677.1 alpha/beta hydrolase [Delftia sp. Lp-1]